MAELKLDMNYIESKIQNILNREFKDIPQKRVIKRFPTNSNPDRLNFACPICGDSERTLSKKRGNLYFKNMQYICFNSDGCSRSFLKLLDSKLPLQTVSGNLSIFFELDGTKLKSPPAIIDFPLFS